MLVHEMHPDLFPAAALSEDAKDLMKRYNFKDQLEDLTRFYLTEGVDIPYGISTFVYVTKYNDSNIDVEKTQKELAKYMRILKNLGAEITKHYREDSFTIVGEFPSGLKIRIVANRESVCTKKVVGTEWVPATAGFSRDVVEWDCERVSFTKLED